MPDIKCSEHSKSLPNISRSEPSTGSSTLYKLINGSNFKEIADLLFLNEDNLEFRFTLNQCIIKGNLSEYKLSNRIINFYNKNKYYEEILDFILVLINLYPVCAFIK